MNILVVEDSSFNAFCLQRLLQNACPQMHITLAQNSEQSMALAQNTYFDLMILDGDLGADDGEHCNGPALADVFLRENPWQPMIAWTSCEIQKKAFKKVFVHYHKPVNELTLWSKVVSPQKIIKSMEYLGLGAATNSKQSQYPHAI